MTTPQVSIQLRTFRQDDPGSFSYVLDQARAADVAGIDRVAVSYHVAYGENLEAYGDPKKGGSVGGKQPTDSDGNWLEPLTVLTAMGALTERIRLNTAILIAALRTPTVLAKQAATIDVLTGRRFLVIEDEESVRNAMTRLFDSWGCESLLVSSAQQAIALNGMRPHAVIADFRLRSGETGIAAIAAVRAHYGADLPALLVTGDARAETLAAAQDAGCPLLTKPVRAARLRSALAHLLRA